jgi:hypothetical protein
MHTVGVNSLKTFSSSSCLEKTLSFVCLVDVQPGDLLFVTLLFEYILVHLAPCLIAFMSC